MRQRSNIFSRRSAVRALLAAPAILLASRLSRSESSLANTGHELSVIPQRHAVIVVTDSAVPAVAAHRQCETFSRGGLCALHLRVAASEGSVALEDFADTCNARIAELRADANTKTITVLAWCELDSPLKSLPPATTADALAVRLFGTTAMADDGILDPDFIDSLPGPDAFFDCTLFAGDGYRPFVPRTDPAYMAYQLHFHRLRRDGRPFSVQFGDHLDPTPWHYDDLPLINGKLLGDDEI